MFFFLKYLHIIGAIILLGSVFTIDIMTLKLILSKKSPGLQLFYSESKFVERLIIGPSSVLTAISGIIMALLWFGWPFWLVWGIVVVAFTGFTGSVTIPRLKKRLVDIISKASGEGEMIKKLTFKFILFISIDLLLLLSAVWTMIYKPSLL